MTDDMLDRVKEECETLGLPSECCDEWPECTHMLYAVTAADAATERCLAELARYREALGTVRWLLKDDPLANRAVQELVDAVLASKETEA